MRFSPSGTPGTLVFLGQGNFYFLRPSRGFKWDGGG